MRTQGTLRGIAARAASWAPMQEQHQAAVTVEGGLVDDYRGGGLRQVTLLDIAQWQEALRELGSPCHGTPGGPISCSKASVCLKPWASSCRLAVVCSPSRARPRPEPPFSICHIKY
jgi:hypothetical protein